MDGTKEYSALHDFLPQGQLNRYALSASKIFGDFLGSSSPLVPETLFGSSP